MAPFLLSEHFLDYLRSERRYSFHTLIAYRNDLEQFIDYSGITSLQDLKEVSVPVIRGWIVELMENDRDAVTVNRKLSTLRSFYKWLMKTDRIDKNPMRLIKGPKKSKKLPVFAKKSDLDQAKLNDHFEDDFDGVRDRLMIETFYQTGVRLSELIGLKDQDVRTDSIKVLGKRNKERIIPISNDYNNLVRTYLKLRTDICRENDDFFVTNRGKKLSSNFVYRKINNYLSRVTELDKKSPHVLRHTFATHMLNNGAGLEVLKELLGHEDLKATQVYTHNSFAQLTQIYSQSHPRGHKN